MKTRFLEYYKMSTEQIEKIWKGDSLVVFDTNILLNLYCYTSETCKEFFDVMSFYKDRLWIPYQVAWEYHQNRVNKIGEYASEYSKIVDLITKNAKSIIGEIQKHEGRTRISLVKIEEKIQKCYDAICKELEKEKKECPDYLDNDTILEEVTTFYTNKVGDDFSPDELKKICEEGKKRYENKTPPGYYDEANKKNNNERSLYGDLILWMQIIKECGEKKKDVIFVTNDKKGDWWLIKDGKTLGARPELLKEFHRLTGQQIILYNGERFLNYAKEHTKIKLNKKTIEEVVKYKDYDSLSLLDIPSILDQNYKSRYDSSLYSVLDELGRPKLSLDTPTGYDSSILSVARIPSNPEFPSLLNSKTPIGYASPSVLGTAGIQGNYDLSSLQISTTPEGNNLFPHSVLDTIEMKGNLGISSLLNSKTPIGGYASPSVLGVEDIQSNHNFSSFLDPKSKD